VGVGLDRPHSGAAHLVLEIDAADLPTVDDDQLDAPEVRCVLVGVAGQAGRLGRGVLEAQ
jgi:hypothetical protein